jgi:hypothetical protein
MTRDETILPTCRSQRDRKRAPCVLDRGDGIDQVLGDVLRDHPTLKIEKAIRMLDEAGW